MAHYTKIPLADQNSHNYLIHSGFILAESCFGSYYIYPSSCHLLLPKEKLIRNKAELYSAIFDYGEKSGYSRGVDAVIQSLKSTVESSIKSRLFPPDKSSLSASY